MQQSATAVGLIWGSLTAFPHIGSYPWLVLRGLIRSGNGERKKGEGKEGKKRGREGKGGEMGG